MDKKEYRVLFSERLSLLIKYKGLTNAELARAINVSPALITKYITGKASPSYENFIKIADYFNVSMDYLRGRSNSFDGDPIGRSNIDAWLKMLEGMDIDEVQEEKILECLRIMNHKLK
ncbi:helix-turn-helix domain-containing protein [Bacillus massiliglaciei]|uniref:helix-turn-helix domain-containing protein n=1 Tax=Bacillus massiliglaciei TaxID=1816693 RepID=UPI001F47F185|nr:helix-turn-helix transcriptional regulator [Bacillus massiliglaciei]